jgi:uncharacterized membrane protein YwaF
MGAREGQGDKKQIFQTSDFRLHLTVYSSVFLSNEDHSFVCSKSLKTSYYLVDNALGNNYLYV